MEFNLRIREKINRIREAPCVHQELIFQPIEMDTQLYLEAYRSGHSVADGLNIVNVDYTLNLNVLLAEASFRALHEMVPITVISVPDNTLLIYSLPNIPG